MRVPTPCSGGFIPRERRAEIPGKERRRTGGFAPGTPSFPAAVRIIAIEFLSIRSGSG
jgi:hypothetical protein